MKIVTHPRTTVSLENILLTNFSVINQYQSKIIFDQVLFGTNEEQIFMGAQSCCNLHRKVRVLSAKTISKTFNLIGVLSMLEMKNQVKRSIQYKRNVHLSKTHMSEKILNAIDAFKNFHFQKFSVLFFHSSLGKAMKREERRQKQPPEVFFKKAVLKNFAMFKGLQFYLKRESSTGLFL